jgi:hypothetical protein
MAYDIEFAYVSKEIQEIYERHGGFIQGNEFIFCGFKTAQGLITGIHMRGGFYGQINKHFMNIFEKKILIPKEFEKFIKSPEKIGYCGLHATNIAGGYFKWKKYKQIKKLEEQDKFLEYLGGGNVLFSYSINKDFSLNPKLIDYEL